MVIPPPVPLHDATDWSIVAIFATVYVGMFLGGLPKLRPDRSGVALLGAIAVIGVGAMSTEQAAQAVDLPTILLLIPEISGQKAGTALALISTFAGNLLLVGSIANLIVVDLAGRSGIAIDWRDHFRIGAPLTLMTLAIVWFWLKWMT